MPSTDPTRQGERGPREDAPRLMVFGATGYTGRHVVQQAAAAGLPTVAHIRPDSPSGERWAAQFEAAGAVVDRSPWEPAAIADSLRRHAIDVAFALLGTTSKKASDAAARGGDASYDAVDVGMSLMVLEGLEALAAQRPKPPRMVYLSALGVSETARGAYLRARWEVESRLHRSSIEWVIARPSFITGPDRGESRPMERIGAAVSDALLNASRWLGATKVHDRFASLSGHDLAAGLLEHGLDRGAVRRTIEADALRPRRA